MSTLLCAEVDGNIAECSEARSLRVREWQDGDINEPKIWQNETVVDDTFSFQIRHFVSTVRQRDFAKCWPFRQRILDKCLSVGLKPFLPPFEPLLKNCDNGEVEYVSHQDAGLHAESEGWDLSNPHKEGDTPDSIEKLAAGEHEGEHERGCVPGTNVSEESNGDGSTGVDLVKSCANQEMGITASEKSKEDELGTRAGMSLHDIKQSNCDIEIDGNGNPKQSEFLLAENNNSCTIKDADFHGSNDNEVDSVSALDSGLGFNSIEGGQQHHKGKFKSLSNEFSMSEEQVGSLKSKSLKAGTIGKVLQDETQLSNERLDHATASCTERNTVAFPPRLERNCRNSDDPSFTGLNLDALVPQVCPVCLNFTSTSNTALNAHIDHCLESVLPGEKGESRVNKHKIKLRKMRSMVDICATAPTRTLEDLERSTKLWALNDEALKESSSCSPSWNNGVVRRQPRTSLHRGLAWKARSTLETDDTPQVSASGLQPQMEKPQGEGFIAKQRGMSGWIHETAMALQHSFEDQELNPEESSGAHAASPMTHSEHITPAKKKKKRDSTNAVLSKEVSMSENCSLSNEDDEDQSWFVSLDLLGFTVIDTSAEEERRLLQKVKHVDGEGTEAGKLPHKRFVEDNGSKSGKFYNKLQFSRGLPFSDLASKKLDKKSPTEIPKKRLRSPIESEQIPSNGETSGEDDKVVFQRLSESPIKTKKAAPKIKSLLTVVANSCKEKGKGVIEGLGTNEAHKSSLCGTNTTPSGGLSGCQETRSKRRSLTSVHEDTREGSCEPSKRARFCPQQPTLSEDLYLCSLSEHGKSPKQSTFSSGTAQIEEGGLYNHCPQQEIRQCPLVEHDDGTLQEEHLGSLTSLLSVHWAGRETSCLISGKRDNVITVANTKDILVKAPLCSTDNSDLSEIEASLCRSRYDSLRKASTSTPSNEVSGKNREDVSKKTFESAELASKLLLPVSQGVLVDNASGSSFSNFKSVDADRRRGHEMLPAIQKSFFPEYATNCQPISNLRTKQPLYGSSATMNSPKAIARDNESSRAKFSPQWYENAQLQAVKDNGRPQTVEEGFDNFGHYKLKCSIQHGTQQAFRAGEGSGLNPNDILLNRENVRNLDNGNHFKRNKFNHMQGRHDLTETLQRISNGTVSPKGPHHYQQMRLGSRFLSSDVSAMISSSASDSLQENGPIDNCSSNGHDHMPMSTISTERMSLSSSLLADLARNCATDSRKSQETLQHSDCFSAEQQRTVQASYHRTNKSRTKGFEYSNMLPLQGAGKSCMPSASNGTMQPPALHTAVQALKANSSFINPDGVNGVGGSVKIHSTLPSVSPFRADPSSSCLNGTRESFLGAALHSNLSNFGTVDYPVDQGVVHIFGNPVFKLMGQNVIVTSNNFKALGPCDQNGVQHFHPSSSIRHLGVLPETQNHCAHNMSPEVYSSTWHGDPCMSRSHSFMMDNLEMQPQGRQSLPPAKPIHLKMPAHKDGFIFKPQVPMCSLDEGSQSVRSTRELDVKKLAVINPAPKMSTEASSDTLPGASSSLPVGLNRASGMIAQQSGRQLTTNNCSLPQNEQQNRAFHLQSTSAAFLEDIQKLDGSGSSTRYRNGTLADIVQCSERNNS